MNREQAESLLAQMVFDELEEPVRSQLLEYLKGDAELSEQLGDMRLTAKLLRDAIEAEDAPKLDDESKAALRMRIEKEPKRKEIIAVIGPYLASRAVAIVASVAICALLVGIFLPALGSARRSARQMKSTTQARGIGQGMAMYAQQNKGRYPERLSQLVEDNYISAEYLISPNSNTRLPSNFNELSQQKQNEWIDQNSSFKLLAGGERARGIDTEQILGYMEHGEGKGVSIARGDGSASYELGDTIRGQIAEQERAEVTGGVSVAGAMSFTDLSDDAKVEMARKRLAEKKSGSINNNDALHEHAIESAPSGNDSRFAGGGYGGGGTYGDFGEQLDGEQLAKLPQKQAEVETHYFYDHAQTQWDMSLSREPLGRESDNAPPLAGAVALSDSRKLGLSDQSGVRRIERNNELPALELPASAAAPSTINLGTAPVASVELFAEGATTNSADSSQLAMVGQDRIDKAAEVRRDKPEFKSDDLALSRHEAIDEVLDGVKQPIDPAESESLVSSFAIPDTDGERKEIKDSIIVGNQLTTTTDLQPTARKPRLMPVNPWVMTDADRLSTFALDVDNASYGIARKYINDGFLPPKHTVRMEEFVNNFDYNYPTGQNDSNAFTVHSEARPSPYTQGNVLMKIGVRGKVVGRDQARPAHLVFVIDTSGSMDRDDRLPLVQQSLTMALDQLSPQDQVSVVTYGTGANLIVENESAEAVERLKHSVNSLQVGGSTNLLAGVALGNDIAKRHYVSGGVNRVILCSDGVANVGPSDADDLLAQAANYREQGVTFTSVGFGAGSYDDRILEQLANRGDGGYHFVGSVDEAKRLFVDDLAATRPTIAYDGKIQVDFDPARVRRYRLIGYENRDIADADFRNDTVDAGEVGSGQSATALYELELNGPVFATNGQPDLGTVYVRYRDADTIEIREIESRLTNSLIDQQTPVETPRFFLAASAARFAEILRGSEHVGPTDTDENLAEIQSVMEVVAAELPLDGQAAELRDLITQSRGLPRAE
jgi:Ca-activated chloride channel family protein